MSIESYALRSWWGNRQETAISCAARLARTVNRLADFDTVFGRWDKCETPVDAADMVKLFENSRYYYDFPPDKAISELGYRVQMSNLLPKPDAALLDMQVGAYSKRNNPHANCFSIAFSRRRLRTMREWSASELRQIMRVVTEEWDVREASVDCFRYKDRHRQYADKYGQKRLFFPWEGWITFVPWPQSSLIAPPDGVVVERLENGGAFFTLCEEPFTIDNPRHMALAATMQIALKLIQTPPV